ncbi:LysR substrate-binding domain-containing protein [Variovorax sp. VNK109]|uniref:LysR family transcriptional regulator n=1 Tax=Variovorax sp. VNK109 TaxID=3400919 RepID=UPI003C0CE86B
MNSSDELSYWTSQLNARRPAIKITLRQIEGFLAAADTLSFSRAAQRMHLTQSAFSQLIREVEQALDLRLFDRTTRRVTLTESGATLVHKMREGLRAIEEACEDAQAISRLERGHLSVATLPSLAVGCVAQALGDLRRLYPGVTVSLHEAQNPELLAMVAQSQVEFAVCARVHVPQGLTFENVFAEELVAVVLDTHRLAGKSRQRWKSLAGTPLILMTHNSSTREQIERALRANGMDDEPTYEVASLFTALSMVRAGLGLTVMPLTAVLETNFAGLASCRLVQPTALRQIGICRRSDRQPSPAALQFAQLVSARVARALQPGISTEGAPAASNSLSARRSR